MLAYFDCFSGISGDMTLGALLDLGVDFKYMEQEIGKLGLTNYKLSSKNVVNRGISATQMNIEIESSEPKGHKHVHYTSIKKRIEDSNLDDRPKKLALEIFHRIAVAEGGVHGISTDKISFHEIGATDSIIDIVGASVGITQLGVDRIVSSPVDTGGGTVEIVHGTYPIPGPATVLLLKDFPAYASGIQQELTTPTGAAIISTVADQVGSLPLMKIQKVGYGAGTRDLGRRPNVLRVILGEEVSTLREETLMIVETNIDDMNPEFYQPLMERLLRGGVLDVYLTPVLMKKNRPGQLISVLTSKTNESVVLDILFRETTTFGVRSYEVNRRCLDREIKSVNTRYGDVRVKIGTLDGQKLKATPEYEDCRKLAEETGQPIYEIYQAALESGLKLLSK